ncbi:hypothetical protein GCM10023069_46530 [Shinella granuli]
MLLLQPLRKFRRDRKDMHVCFPMVGQKVFFLEEDSPDKALPGQTDTHPLRGALATRIREENRQAPASARSARSQAQPFGFQRIGAS